MKDKTVKDLMIPLSEYATVSIDATLFDAVQALKKAQDAFDKDQYRHRAVLIFDENHQIVGKVSQLDILRALEPKYETMGNIGMRRLGFTPQFMKSMLEQFKLWDSPLEDICRKAARIKVASFMYTPSEGEYIDENASLNEAIHQIVMGHHQSILVTRKGVIVGVLRLTDMYRAVRLKMQECQL